jgi:serine phosphatase RsbU (regulator of sigma subunit)/CHASE3 domain sensor protein
MLPSKMKIKTKLIVGFGLMLMLLVITSAISLVSMNSLVKKLEHTLDEDARLTEISSGAFASAMSIGQYEREMILNIKEKSFKDGSIRSSWDGEVLVLTSRLDILEVMVKKMNRSGELNFLNEAREFLQKNVKGFRDLLSHVDSGKIRTIEDAQEAFKQYRNDGLSLELVINSMTTRAIRDMQSARESVDNMMRWSRISIIGGAFLSVLLGIVISLLVASGIRGPLNEIVNSLKDSNLQLSSANNALEQAHLAAARDMKIAVNVQQSMLQKNPPKNGEWDIAFDFKPKSGVSGDFYEFYMHNDTLIGAGIFDVSGHGISSGLITMLAKSIINRNFMAYRDEPLNKVLKRINTELIHEFGGVDNYLTGILLRFSGDSCEYVNAGHTELLFKRIDSEVKIIQPKDEDMKGYFLGVAEMGSQFRALTYTTVKGDTFLLYSDCIIETLNPRGESFGITRLLSLFNSFNGDVTAAVIVETIMKELFNFSETAELKDDLTLIALKKK